MQKPDERLKTLFDMVPNCNVVADVGTDHGYLGLMLLQGNKANKVLFTDISPLALKKARLLIDKTRMQDKAEFYTGDGLTACPYVPNCAVIAGMGGDTICGIIKRAHQNKALPQTLIIEANVGISDVRHGLADAGYKISDEKIARLNGRHYTIIKAEPGEARYDPIDYEVGPILRLKNDINFEGLKAFKVRVLTKALTGAQKANAPEQDKLKNTLDIWSNQ